MVEIGFLEHPYLRAVKNMVTVNGLCYYMTKSLNCNLQSKQLVAPLFFVFDRIYVACKFLDN